MNSNKKLISQVLFLLIFVLSTAGSLAQTPPGSGKMAGYPEPRFPKMPVVNSVEDLLPAARIIALREKGLNMRPGYAIKGGERILFFVNDYVDPWVVEAFKRVFKENNATVDVFTQESVFKEVWDRGQTMERSVYPERFWRTSRNVEHITQGRGITLEDFARAQGYDLVVGRTFQTGEEGAQTTYGIRMMWPTRYVLASEAEVFPQELIEIIERKGWEIIRQARSVHMTDPEGTDLTWSFTDEHWQVVEGAHPSYPVHIGGITHKFGPGESENPIIPGHMMAFPIGIIFETADASGVIGATTEHGAAFPYMKIKIEKNQIASLEGGGRYGELWKEFIEKTKDIHYISQPRPGNNFLTEVSICTNPKITRPHDILHTRAGRSAWVLDRMRSCVIHIGIGLNSRRDWAVERGYPTNHFHTHLYFPTVTIETRDGRSVNVCDKGHLTVLDDPEVRAVAAKYGDPDELLREDWIPGIPGINMEGDYMRDYAQDPREFYKRQQEEHYGDLIQKSIQQYGP
jgi:hypothetical protein